MIPADLARATGATFSAATDRPTSVATAPIGREPAPRDQSADRCKVRDEIGIAVGGGKGSRLNSPLPVSVWRELRRDPFARPQTPHRCQQRTARPSSPSVNALLTQSLTIVAQRLGKRRSDRVRL